MFGPVHCSIFPGKSLYQAKAFENQITVSTNSSKFHESAFPLCISEGWICIGFKERYQTFLMVGSSCIHKRCDAIIVCSINVMASIYQSRQVSRLGNCEVDRHLAQKIPFILVRARDPLVDRLK
jgi:hypothetical protein